MGMLVTNATCLSLCASISNVNAAELDGVLVSSKSISDNLKDMHSLYDQESKSCLLYTSDAADDQSRV